MRRLGVSVVRGAGQRSHCCLLLAASPAPTAHACRRTWIWTLTMTPHPDFRESFWSGDPERLFVGSAPSPVPVLGCFAPSVESHAAWWWLLVLVLVGIHRLTCLRVLTHLQRRRGTIVSHSVFFLENPKILPPLVPQPAAAHCQNGGGDYRCLLPALLAHPQTPSHGSTADD